MASTNQDNKSNNIDIQKMVEFVKKNARYFVAGALFVVLLLILVKFTGNGTGNADDNNVAVTETVVTEEAYEENAVPAVNELINSYFTAYASGDLVTLQTLATPITQNEQSYITLISQYIEQYQDINCYTKSGLDSNSYMVNVSLNVKFMGVETPAPGLYFFYARPWIKLSVTGLLTVTMYSFSCIFPERIILLTISPLFVSNNSPSESLSRRPTG
jgi:hypothetical protein